MLLTDREMNFSYWRRENPAQYSRGGVDWLSSQAPINHDTNHQFNVSHDVKAQVMAHALGNSGEAVLIYLAYIEGMFVHRVARRDKAFRNPPIYITPGLFMIERIAEQKRAPWDHIV